MILLFSQNNSPRVQYSCSFIFKELMGVEYSITNNVDEFKNFDAVKINYSNNKIADNELMVFNYGLLFENDIRLQNTQCFEHNGYKTFFKGADEDFPFDIFSAAFFLLSCYEEYLPHEKDMYGRYDHENSLAFKENFLHLPLINIWVNDFANSLRLKYPAFTKILNEAEAQSATFNFLPTYDIDIAYAYKQKGLLRNAGGFLKSPSLERIKVLAGLQKDPFDTYDWLDILHQQYQLQPVYFFLLAQKNGLYDKNILPHKAALKQLIKKHAAKYPTGIHPSWQSGDNFLLMKQEKKLLQDIVNRPVTQSRQHYIRFSLPHGYRRLMEAGITDDYSMGYGSINGFRASAASSFYWYDLETEKQTSLRIHPFCFMEANCFYEQHLSPQEAYEELMHYYKACKEVNGTLITIWHNNFFGSDKLFAGWKEVYEQFIAQVQ
jgi:hypothetical protein